MILTYTNVQYPTNVRVQMYNVLQMQGSKGTIYYQCKGTCNDFHVNKKSGQLLFSIFLVLFILVLAVLFTPLLSLILHVPHVKPQSNIIINLSELFFEFS